MPGKSYLLGRLLAVLAREGALNTPTQQRAVELGMSFPAQVIVPAISNLIENGKGDAIAEIMEQLPPTAFGEGTQNMYEQSEFALGYYHERGGVARPLQLGEEDTSTLTERYEVRMEPDLKQWMLQHGGAPLIRSLLRVERERQKSNGVVQEERKA